MNSKKPLIIVGAAVILVVALAAGYYFGNQKGNKEGAKKTEEKLSPLVNLAFPKPPDEINNLTGVIKEIYGANINFEVADPNDYLPHADGAPRKKESRSISVSQSTEIVALALDKQGNIKRVPLKFSDLKIGDKITVRSNENIRDAQKFDATKIEVLKF